jgi:hypothetical protein
LRDEHDVRAACEHVFVLYRPPYRPAYSYMLGMYLGDGCLTGRERCKQFVVALDAAYPEIIDECWVAMALTLPGCRPVKQKMHYECVRVVSGSVRWPEVFPQHGPGRKHDRPIVLEPWQREIVDAFPREFLRGLIHSDGCRTVNRFKTKLPSGRVARVRLSAVLLLEPLVRHPRAVLRVLRPTGDPVDAVQPPQHLRVAPPQRRGAGRVHRP